jgi:PHP family Zn ribbon phosphoesterase
VRQRVEEEGDRHRRIKEKRYRYVKKIFNQMSSMTVNQPIFSPMWQTKYLTQINSAF